MVKISHAILFDLEEELSKISFDYDNPIPICDKSIECIAIHLKVLKEHVLQHQFQSIEDEVKFFKIIKPKFSSKLISFKKLETCNPMGGKKMRRT